MSTRQNEARALAYDLITDIELGRLNSSELVLKASRLARLTGHEYLNTLVTLERDGYKGSAPEEWVRRTGRIAEEKEDGKYTLWTYSIGEVEAQIRSAEGALQALRGGGNYSGDYIITASGNHDGKIQGAAATLRTVSAIRAAVIAAVYGYVTEIYHELLFSELQESLFSATQIAVDGALRTSRSRSTPKNREHQRQAA
ncbi:hypothetical protein [Occultella kanbiaonis]|uniref:AbiTii domain-containing protein n=1 Tax=Occultella kanbiaonis TaxID=2675754 RepID=UPI001B354FB5|nr:hypothetical protein [Occultella kanbiaonis]